MIKGTRLRADKLIRQERYVGAMQRSFYVGEHVTENNARAKFEDGVPHLELLKEETHGLPEKNHYD